jgi:hypothetical protein
MVIAMPFEIEAKGKRAEAGAKDEANLQHRVNRGIALKIEMAGNHMGHIIPRQRTANLLIRAHHGSG